MRRTLSFSILAIGCMIWLNACNSGWAPTPTTLPQTRVVPAGSLTSPPPSHTPTPRLTPTLTLSPTPTAAPSPRPTAEGERDAFAVTHFPWADSPAAFPMYTGEGRARVVNSIFFEEPPFFGFDIQPPEGWYHVVGADAWAATDVELISPTINRLRQPRDGDRVLIYGHIQGSVITASYLGFDDGTFHYYRSLLHMDELRSGMLPPVYDGLDVWVRGILDVSEGRGQFYVLPEGTSFDPVYVGQEALVAGRLFIGESIGVEVTKGIYVKDDSRYTEILQGRPATPARDVFESGIIRAVDPSGHWLLLEADDGRSVEVNLSEDTRIEFADGSGAAPTELALKRRIEVLGQASGKDRLSGTKATIIGTATEGPMYAAYIAGGNGDLWSVSLDGRERRQITRLASPRQGLANAGFSPDGLHFAFAHQEGPQSTLVVGDLQSGELREWLTEDQWQESDPTWSPDGARLALCRHRLEGQQLMDGALWILTLEYGVVRRVTGPAAEGWRIVQPLWSPDGRHIALGEVSDDPAQPTKLDVLSFPPQSQRIFEYGRDWRWSADSTQLLCTRQEPAGNRVRIWVVQRDGSSATWLSTTGVHDHHGRWSPDGTAIAFLSRPVGSGGPDHLWIMQADGMRRFQPEGQPLASQVAWSPDSQDIVFMRVTASAENAGLWIVGRDGSGLRELAADAAQLVGTYRTP